MKEAVTRVLNTLTQEDFQATFQKLLERYNKCIDVGGEYFEGDLGFLYVRLIKVSIPKKSGNLLNAPRTCLEKERVQSKVIPTKVGVGLKRIIIHRYLRFQEALRESTALTYFCLKAVATISFLV